MSPVRRWVLLAGAVLVWGTLYQLNLRWWNWVVYGVFGLDRRTRLAGSVHFFFYDITKIVLLLAAVIFAVTVLRPATLVVCRPSAPCRCAHERFGLCVRGERSHARDGTSVATVKTKRDRFRFLADPG